MPMRVCVYSECTRVCPGERVRAMEQEPAEGPFNKLHLIVKGVSPIISHESFVTPNATTGGKVTLGDESRMWYGFAVRGTRTPCILVC